MNRRIFLTSLPATLFALLATVRGWFGGENPNHEPKRVSDDSDHEPKHVDDDQLSRIIFLLDDCSSHNHGVTMIMTDNTGSAAQHSLVDDIKNV